MNTDTATQHVTFKAESSIIHGGGISDSNIQTFRRESVITTNGITTVPIVSGNALRGILRRVGAWELWQLLGRPKLTESAVRAISSGGALTATAGLSQDQRRQLEVCSHLGLFGGAWRGTIETGAISVGKIMLNCAELGTSPLRAGSQMDLEQYVRHDSSPIPLLGTDTENEDAPTESNQMIYQVETVATGSTWSGWVALKPWAQPHHINWFALCWSAWQNQGGHIGGKSATGHGRLITDWTPGGNPDEAKKWAVDHRDETIEALSWI